MATAPARLLLTLIDYGAPLAIVLGMGNALGADVPDWNVEGWTSQPRLLGALLACILFNQVILVGFNGMSLGGILLGLRVVDARDKDRPPGFVRALARLLLEIPGLVITVFLYVLGRRQALNDLATGTALVYV